MNKLIIKGKFEKKEKKNRVKESPVIYNKNKVLNQKNIKKILIPKKDLDKKNEIKNSIKRKSDNKYQFKYNNIKSKNNNVKKNSKLIEASSVNKIKESNFENNNTGNRDKLNIKSNKLEINRKLVQKFVNIKINKSKNLTDYELNNLEYDSAIKLDNRNFFEVYFYFLRREHIIFFTFFYCNDFNIFGIKLSKFFLAICSDMAFNVFFFSDKSMHNIYIRGGEHDFISQLTQMIYSTIVSQILQIFINYLTMTDITYFSIKELSKKKHMNINQIKSIMT